jgi:hypothetical protein
MSLKPSDIDVIIDLVTQIAEALSKTDFLSLDERQTINFDKTDLVVLLKDKLSKAKQKYIESTIKPLQKELELYLSPRWPEILHYSEPNHLRQDIEAFLYNGHLTDGFIQDIFTFCRSQPIETDYSSVLKQKEKVVNELERIKANLEYKQAQEPAGTERNTTSSKRGRIGTWLWKLYEKTLKAFFDAILEKMQSK